MMNFIVIVVVSTLSWVVMAEKTESSMLKQISQSQRKIELEDVIKRYDRTRLATRACELQLLGHVLPEQCYVALNSAQKIVLESFGEVNREFIEQKCRFIATSTREIRNSITLEMSSTCHSIAQKQIEINLYKLGLGFENQDHDGKEGDFKANRF